MSYQGGRIIVPDTEHVVHQYGAKDVEADVGPADAKVAPALAVDYDRLS